MADRSNFIGNLSNTRPPDRGVGSEGAPPFSSSRGNPGLPQADGNRSPIGQRPTRAPLQTRTVDAGSGYQASGIDQAMSDMADQLHKPVTKGPRGNGR